MSFKYRFIISFVLIETFFIILIVSVNFITISNSSKKLIDDKIESNTVFLEQLIKVPVSIYDMASLDDLVNSTAKYINSMVILDSEDRVLSSNYKYKFTGLDELLKSKEDKSYTSNEESYEIVYKELFQDDILIGSMYIIYDTSENTKFISSNTNKTLLIIFLEIIISTFLSYLIGTNLTKKLTNLSRVAFKIGKEEKIDVPFTTSKDEIGILAKSMSIMQDNLSSRNKELKDYNKALRKQKYELIELTKSKDDFLANMSHELKTPLNSINVISDVMMRNRTKNLNDKQIKNLNIINKCGKDLLFLINDILDISKLEAGQILLNNDNINIKELITSIYDMFYPQTKEKGINFVLKIDDALEFMYSDTDRIKQIIKNLLSNALKFTEHGKISLIINDLGKDVSFIVKDQGIGIPSDKLEHIFDRFKQVDESTTRRYGGTGLGLAICKELSHLLGGDITVSSEINKGSEFKLVIPKHDDLIKGLEILEIKSSTEKTSTKKIVKSEVLEKEVIQSTTQSNNEIIVFNNNPVTFFNVVIKLKNYYEVKQIKSLREIKNNENKIVIDTDSLTDEDLVFIENNNIQNIIALKEKEVNKKLLSRVILVLDKTIDDLDYSKI